MDVTRQDLNQLSAENIKDLLLQHDVVVKKGSGKSGRVTKSDCINAFLQSQNNVNDDNIKDIMLLSDFKTMKSLCLTNKRYSSICQDVKFWEQKIKLNHLLLLIEPKNVKEWRNYYERIENLTVYVNNVFNLLDFTTHEFLNIHIIVDDDELETLNNIISTNETNITFSYRKRYNDYEMNGIPASKQQVYDALIKVMYFFEDNTITIEMEP